MTSWTDVLTDLPLIAILRGVRPDEAEAVAEALCEAGFRCLEVPLNSPEPLESLRLMRAVAGDRAMVGAGTVLTPEAADAVADAGGQLVISPNTDVRVIAATKARGLVSLPAFLTPSEGLAALAAGADALKLFPAEAAAPKVLKAMKAILPPAAPVLPVGGVEEAAMEGYVRAGAAGFGLGSTLYKPGATPKDIFARACSLIQAWRRCNLTRRQ